MYVVGSNHSPLDTACIAHNLCTPVLEPKGGTLLLLARSLGAGQSPTLELAGTEETGTEIQLAGCC
jgi:hypothetical protein